MQMNKRTKESTGKSVQHIGKIGGEFTPEKNPAFIQHRQKVFTEIMKVQDQVKE